MPRINAGTPGNIALTEGIFYLDNASLSAKRPKAADEVQEVRYRVFQKCTAALVQQETRAERWSSFMSTAHCP